MYLGLAFTLLPFYVILLYSGAGALFSFHSFRRKLSRAGLLGMMISAGDWHWDKHVFEEVFFGGWQYRNAGSVRHVVFDDLIIVMIAVMGALVYVAWEADPDGRPISGRMRDELPPGNREPEFLAAEIVPPKEDESSRRAPDVR
jgi:hypothetical protein